VLRQLAGGDEVLCGGAFGLGSGGQVWVGVRRAWAGGVTAWPWRGSTARIWAGMCHQHRPAAHRSEAGCRAAPGVLPPPPAPAADPPTGAPTHPRRRRCSRARR
jgi:hypothetical protein